jgi:hypothetical protein
MVKPARRAQAVFLRGELEEGDGDIRMELSF